MMFGNKSFLNLLCWGFVAFGLVKAADAQSSKSPTTSKPATQTTVFDLPVRYAVGAKGFAVVGFVNTDAKIYYMWRDVSLPLDTVPNLDEEHRQPLFDPLAAGYRTVGQRSQRASAPWRAALSPRRSSAHVPVRVGGRLAGDAL